MSCKLWRFYLNQLQFQQDWEIPDRSTPFLGDGGLEPGDIRVCKDADSQKARLSRANSRSIHESLPDPDGREMVESASDRLCQSAYDSRSFSVIFRTISSHFDNFFSTSHSSIDRSLLNSFGHGRDNSLIKDTGNDVVRS